MENLLLTVSYTNGHLKNGKGDFWADSYLKNTEVAQNGSLHLSVKKAIEEVDSAEVCCKGKPISSVYRDVNGQSVVVGYIYKVKHFISDRNSNFEGYAYFDAWVTIKQTQNLELPEVI